MKFPTKIDLMLVFVVLCFVIGGYLPFGWNFLAGIPGSIVLGKVGGKAEKWELHFGGKQ